MSMSIQVHWDKFCTYFRLINIIVAVLLNIIMRELHNMNPMFCTLLFSWDMENAPSLCVNYRPSLFLLCSSLTFLLWPFLQRAILCSVIPSKRSVMTPTIVCHVLFLLLFYWLCSMYQSWHVLLSLLIEIIFLRHKNVYISIWICFCILQDSKFTAYSFILNILSISTNLCF